MWNRMRRFPARRDEQMERWRSRIGEPVSYPVPTRIDPPEAFDVLLKRKRVVVAAVEGRMIDGMLRLTDIGRGALDALCEATGGAAYEEVIVPEPSAARRSVMEALSNAPNGTAIAFIGADMAIVNAVKRQLNVRRGAILAQRAGESWPIKNG